MILDSDSAVMWRGIVEWLDVREGAQRKGREWRGEESIAVDKRQETNQF